MDAGRHNVYAEGLRSAVRANSSAFGFSIMITSSFGAASILLGEPALYELYLFAFGAVAGFVSVHLVATHAFSEIDDEAERTRIQLLAAVFSVVSVLSGLGCATLVAWLGTGWWGWLLAPVAASAAFLLVNGAEFTAAELEEEEAEEAPT